MIFKDAALNRVILLVALCIAVACAPRGRITYDPQAAGVGMVEQVYVGTMRAALPEGGFGTERSETPTYARYDISVPPVRKLGSIDWPPRHGKPDPRRHYLTTAAKSYPETRAFRKDLAADLRKTGGEAVVFVHGYNNNFSEGLYRVAQLAHDLEIPGVEVHYSWPSAANPLGYVYDRDSAIFARDGLSQLLNEIEDAGATRILLVAHSMGSALTMEALRSLALRGDKATLAKLSGVILISPDIDVDVFREQAKAIGALPQPFLIFGSNRDRVLRFSAGLTGQKERLGSLSDLERLADLKVTFLDVGAFAKGSSHFLVGDSPSLILLLGKIADVDNVLEAERARRVGLLPGVVLSVQNATQIVLQPIATVGNELTR